MPGSSEVTQDTQTHPSRSAVGRGRHRWRRGALVVNGARARGYHLNPVTGWTIHPDGHGLPDGQGTAATGAAIYRRLCASCHGHEGEGANAAPLVGAEKESTPPFGPRYETWRGDRPDVLYTVGNYWPYATTLFDYINRAMPSNAPGSLAADQVYGLVAWRLATNGLIANDAVMSAETLPAVDMPARGIFVPVER